MRNLIIFVIFSTTLSETISCATVFSSENERTNESNGYNKQLRSKTRFYKCKLNFTRPKTPVLASVNACEGDRHSFT